MPRNLNIFLQCLVVGILQFSCAGEEEKEEVVVVEEESFVWTDSIFGSFSEKERYFQHFIVEVPRTYQARVDSFSSWVVENQPGGIKLIDWNADTISQLKTGLDSQDIIQPFFFTDYFDLLNLPAYPYWESSKKSRGDDLAKVFSKGRFNLVDLRENFDWSENMSSWTDSLKKKLGVSTVVRHYSDKNLKRDFDSFSKDLMVMNQIIGLSLSAYDTVQLQNFRFTSNYEGLFLVDAMEVSANSLLAGGADLLFKSIDTPDQFDDWSDKKGGNIFEESTKRILQLKSRIATIPVQKQNLDSEIKFVRSNLTQQSTVLLSNKNKLIPFKKRFSIYSLDKVGIRGKVKKENEILVYQKELSERFLKKVTMGDDPKVLCLSDTATTEQLEVVSQLTAEKNTLVCFSNPDHYQQLSRVPNLLFYPGGDDFDYTVFVQQLTGRIAMGGNFASPDSLVKGVKIKKQKLARTSAEFVGLDTDTLRRIDWAVNNALNGRAFPGCQVLLAKDGCIIYDKSFGYHSYDREKLVTEESIYDLASVTKCVATTMLGMKLYEMKSFSLDDSLGMYLPDSLKFHLNFPSTIRNITFQELFIHKSGLPAGFPIIRYMDYTSEEVGRLDKYFCDVEDSAYCIEVAENFFLEREYGDSMWLKLNQIWLDPNKPYKYSDVSMNTLYAIFKSIISNDRRKYNYLDDDEAYEEVDLFEEFLYDTYYRPLEMERTRYLPLRFFNKQSIVPTEDENWWRKQLLRGHVHDPYAALLGGVAGNAGMFSTTNDLAILCQMLLNKGHYGGRRYLAAETVDKFSSRQPESHRGLGWNKPTITSSGYGCADSASLATFGHTGFTGTCIWMDPRTEIFYIFLSNRVHPKVNNRIYQHGIRKRIHQTAYDAMMNGSGVRNE